MSKKTALVQMSKKNTSFQQRGVFDDFTDANEHMQHFEWDFDRWASKFYKGERVNVGFEAKWLLGDFLEKYPRSKACCDMRRFKKRLAIWCGKNGYTLNPHRSGMSDTRDRSNGVEYFVVGDKDFELRFFKRIPFGL
jgi:hypothetical protein